VLGKLICKASVRMKSGEGYPEKNYSVVDRSKKLSKERWGMTRLQKQQIMICMKNFKKYDILYKINNAYRNLRNLIFKQQTKGLYERALTSALLYLWLSVLFR
jgi:hypothetical protein